MTSRRRRRLERVNFAPRRLQLVAAPLDLLARRLEEAAHVGKQAPALGAQRVGLGLGGGEAAAQVVRLGALAALALLELCNVGWWVGVLG